MVPPVQHVSPEELRQRFNDGKYFERAEIGEFRLEITEVGPAPRAYPSTSRSQIIRYLDHRDRTVAIIHQYGDEYGNPEPPSLPDPKYLFEGGVRYKISRKTV